VLTITGTSFPNVSEEVTISMGVRRCEVQTVSSTEITCVVPNNPPGEVNVVVDTQNKGETCQDSNLSRVWMPRTSDIYPHTLRWHRLSIYK
jgi:hypothetical protein